VSCGAGAVEEGFPDEPATGATREAGTVAVPATHGDSRFEAYSRSLATRVDSRWAALQSEWRRTQILHARLEEISRATAAAVTRSRELMQRSRHPLGGAATNGAVHVEIDGRRNVLNLDADAHTVEVGDRKMMLTRTEWRLLTALMSRRGDVISKDDLAAQAWGEGCRGRVAEVEMYVSRLRRKLGDPPRHPRIIVTVRGRGYRCTAERGPR
jgi:transcriptional regulator